MFCSSVLIALDLSGMGKGPLFAVVRFHAWIALHIDIDVCRLFRGEAVMSSFGQRIAWLSYVWSICMYLVAGFGRSERREVAVWACGCQEV